MTKGVVTRGSARSRPCVSEPGRRLDRKEAPDPASRLVAKALRSLSLFPSLSLSSLSPLSLCLSLSLSPARSLLFALFLFLSFSLALSLLSLSLDIFLSLSASIPLFLSPFPVYLQTAADNGHRPDNFHHEAGLKGHYQPTRLSSSQMTGG